MKNFLPLLSLLIVFVGCKKDINQALPPGNTADTIQGNTFLVSASRSENAPVTNTAYDLLGYGYDVTGQFADKSAARDQVVNIERLIALYPGRVQFFRTTQGGSPLIFTAENAESFSDQLSDQIEATKGLRVFKGSITAAFPDSNSLSGKYIYGLSTSIIQYNIVKFLYSNYLPVDPILNPAFSADVEKFSAADLVKKYGTHILTNITLGAKFEVTYQAETARADKQEAALVGLTFGLKRVFGLWTGYNFLEGPSPAIGNANQKLFYKRVGGDTTKFPTLIADNAKNPTIDIREWITSCTAETATMVGIDKDGLIPLYDMIKDPLKKVAVKDYIDQYLLAGRVQLKK